MSSTESRPQQRLRELASHFPKQHLVLAGALSTVIGSLLFKPEVFQQHFNATPAPQAFSVAAAGMPEGSLLLPGETLEPEQPFADLGAALTAAPLASYDAQAARARAAAQADTAEADAPAAARAEPAQQPAVASAEEETMPAPSMAPLALDEHLPLAAFGNPLELSLRLPPLSGALPRDQEWVSEIIRPGDNLARLFQRAGAGSTELAALLDSCPECSELKRLSPGRSLDFSFTEGGQLKGLRYQQSDLVTTEVKRKGEKFAAKKLVKVPEVRVQYHTAVIESSLFLAGRKAGLPQQMLIDFAGIFGGVIDFVMDPRKGDTFTVVYEEKVVDGKVVGYGNILSAQFVNQGEVHTAYRYANARGDSGFYNEKGESMRRAFMRAPLDFTRVTSPFNMKRFHPILKTIRPHRGIDYGAPVGTPIYASGDGKVTDSAMRGANGNYVSIQHSSNYTTKYLHLSKRMVKAGQRVKQGQVIGYVGCTGLCSGPHLHYEFLVDGVHRDPKKLINKLAINTKLPPKDMARFASMVRQQKQQLAALQQARSLASLKADEDKGG